MMQTSLFKKRGEQSDVAPFEALQSQYEVSVHTTAHNIMEEQ